MGYSNRSFQLLAGGLRLVRYAWVLTVFGSVGHAYALFSERAPVESIPWVAVLGLSLSVVGLLRCALGASQPAERFWIGTSALCVAMGLLQASAASVILGYLSGAMCFHLFLIQLSRQIGSDPSATNLTHLLVMPFLVLAVSIFFSLFLGWLGGMMLGLVATLGPLYWLIRLLLEIYTLERLLA